MGKLFKKVLAYFMVPIVLQFATLGLVTVGVATQTACSTQTIITDIEKFLPVAGDILQILVASGVMTQAQADAYSSKLSTDSGLVNTVYSTYETALAAGSSTQGATWNALNAAFTTFSNDTIQIFQLAQVSNPNVQNKVTLMVSAAQTILAVIESLMPTGPNGATVLKRFGAHVPEKVNTQVADAFVKTYNQTLKIKTGDSAVDAIKFHELHIHSWAARALSWGRYQ